MPDQAATALWSNIDNIYVINLARRADRWQQFLQKHQAILPPDKIIRIEALDGQCLPGYQQPPWFRPHNANRAHNWSGGAGCALSHRAAIAAAQQRNNRYALILEDDACLLEQADSLQLVRRFLSTAEPDWGLLYLGHHELPARAEKIRARQQQSTLWQIDGVIAAHAYIIPQRAFPFLLKALPNEQNIWQWMARYRAIDRFYRDFFPARSGLKTLALTPVLFEQQSGFSDLAQAFSDHQKSYQGAFPAPRVRSAGERRWQQALQPWRHLVRRVKSTLKYIRSRLFGYPGYRKR